MSPIVYANAAMDIFVSLSDVVRNAQRGLFLILCLGSTAHNAFDDVVRIAVMIEEDGETLGAAKRLGSESKSTFFHAVVTHYAN